MSRSFANNAQQGRGRRRGAKRRTTYTPTTCRRATGSAADGAGLRRDLAGTSARHAIAVCFPALGEDVGGRNPRPYVAICKGGARPSGGRPMTEVHVWRTLVGVVALTPEAFGFSFCANEAEWEKLRQDL